MNIESTDYLRITVNKKINFDNKSKFGQFMTPPKIADYMASLFNKKTGNIKLLDCGAGIGSLTISAVKVLRDINIVELWEIDKTIGTYLESNTSSLDINYAINFSDFIQDAVFNIIQEKGTRFTHAILNPPYKKINSASEYRKALRMVGIETVNLYSAFLALTIMLMEKDGEIVAIIPRSFCNGLYYKSFRKFILKECSIEHIHVFESRDKVFKDDGVLQENIIIKLKKSKAQSNVVISSSFDYNFSDYHEKIVPFENIVKENDNEQFIHIPIGEHMVTNNRLFNVKLKDIGIEVSTGPVVDFRVKEFLEQEPSDKTVPLLYPYNFLNGEFHYPKKHKKPNALRVTPETEKWLMPNGFYVIVKRFTAKEERRRIVAYIINPNEIKTDRIGFENHWNVFHCKKSGINKTIAKGLFCFLNSTEVDNFFRVFSGHTQVNATDLKNIKYPTLETLKKLGEKYHLGMTQSHIDKLVAGII